MPRKRLCEDETSQTVHLKGENFAAVKRYHESFTIKFQTNYSETMNKIIKQWREKTPPAMRGYEKP